MQVRICRQSIPWTHAEGAWFFDHEGEVFEVLAVHDGISRLYEVDVGALAAAGDISVSRAFVPATFAEEVFEPSSAIVGRWRVAG